MEIWVNKVGGDSDSEFKVQMIDGIRDVNDLRKAINQSVECAKAPERFGFGALDIYTNASATAEYKLRARDALFDNDQLKWDSLFFSQPAQPAQQGKKKTSSVHIHRSSPYFCLFLSVVILYFHMSLILCCFLLFRACQR